MIIHSFAPGAEGVITPEHFYGRREKLCDVCVVTFSAQVIRAALAAFPCRRAAEFESATGNTPLYLLKHGGQSIAFYLSAVGSCGAGTLIQEAHCLVGATKYIMFGSCGCLDRAIPAGAAIVPTHAYRDEGFSYHYAPPADYITLPNADRVAGFLAGAGVPTVKGRTWTTDAIFRETRENMARRRAEGCIAVEMECAGAQAVCDFLGLEYFDFLINGDLLDCEVWDQRILGGETERDHQLRNFHIALDLALTLSPRNEVP